MSSGRNPAELQLSTQRTWFGAVFLLMSITQSVKQKELIKFTVLAGETVHTNKGQRGTPPLPSAGFPPTRPVFCKVPQRSSNVSLYLL